MVIWLYVKIHFVYDTFIFVLLFIITLHHFQRILNEGPVEFWIVKVCLYDIAVSMYGY